MGRRKWILKLEEATSEDEEEPLGFKLLSESEFFNEAIRDAEWLLFE